MYGPQDATLLILSSARLDQRVINALESAGKALGHADGVCIATLAEAGEDIAAFIMQGDPWAVAAIDDAVIRELRSAFEPEAEKLFPDAPVDTALGYRLVAVPGFASCLDDMDAKRVAWHRLKAARHPGNPLERQRPTA